MKIAIVRESGDKGKEMADTRLNLAHTYKDNNQIKEANEQLEEALDISGKS